MKKVFFALAFFLLPFGVYAQETYNLGLTQLPGLCGTSEEVVRFLKTEHGMEVSIPVGFAQKSNRELLIINSFNEHTGVGAVIVVNIDRSSCVMMIYDPLETPEDIH